MKSPVAQEKTKPLKLTVKRLRILTAAARHQHGLVSRPYLTGFERVAWDKNAAYLVGYGLLTPYYISNEYEITPEGLRVHKANAEQEGGH